MVIILDIVGDKWEAQKTLRLTWTPPIYLVKDTKYILISMRKIQTVKDLGDIKVDITRESFRSHWIRSR